MTLPLSIRLAIGAILLAIVATVCGAVHHVIYQSGFDDASKIAATEQKKITDKAREEFDKAAATAKQTENDLRKAIADMSADRLTKEANYEKTIADLQSRVLDGSVKLRIAVARRQVPECTATTDSAASGGTGTETTADVLPATASRILGIAGSAAKDVRDYNRVVDLYNAAMKACND